MTRHTLGFVIASKYAVGLRSARSDRLTLEQRARRGADCWRWACATEPERSRLKAEYEKRWGPP